MTETKRGFAALPPERRREIAAMGGAAPKSRRAFDAPEVARRAGRLGGAAVPAEKRYFSQNRAFAAAMGKKGGKAVPDGRRSFSTDRALAAEAGRRGGTSSHRKKRETDITTT